VKNPLKRPPHWNEKKKSLEVTPHWEWEKKLLELIPIVGEERKLLEVNLHRQCVSMLITTPQDYICS
jgi:hypothetical protein